MVIYVRTKFHNMIDGIKVIERTRVSFEKFQRRIILKKNVSGVEVLFLCTLSDGGLYLYQFT